MVVVAGVLLFDSPAEFVMQAEALFLPGRASLWRGSPRAADTGTGASGTLASLTGWHALPAVGGDSAVDRATAPHHPSGGASSDENEPLHASRPSRSLPDLSSASRNLAGEDLRALAAAGRRAAAAIGSAERSAWHAALDNIFDG